MAVVLAQVVGVGQGLGGVGGLPAGLEVAGGELAVDAVPGDQLLDQAVGLESDVPDLAGIVAAEGPLVFAHRGAGAGGELAAVAPRGAPAQPVGLDEDDVEAALGQVQRRREPGIAAADDADIRLVLALEARVVRHLAGGLGVPAPRMHAGAVVGGEMAGHARACQPRSGSVAR